MFFAIVGIFGFLFIAAVAFDVSRGRKIRFRYYTYDPLAVKTKPKSPLK